MGLNSSNSASHSSTFAKQKLKTVSAGRSDDSYAPGLFDTRPGGAKTDSPFGCSSLSGSKWAPSVDSGSPHDLSTD